MNTPSLARSSGRARALMLGLLGAIAAPAGAGSDYTFVNIADDTGAIVCCVSPNAIINNNGTVAFSASMGGGDTDVFTGNGGPLTTIAAGGEGNFSVSGLIGMNDNDVVAVRISESISEQGIWIGDGNGPLTLIALTDENPYTVTELPDINTPGDVVFWGIEPGGTSGLRRAQGFGNYTTIADTNEFVTFGGRGSINDSGTVAFYAGTDLGSGIYTGDGGPVATIVETVDTAFTSIGSTVSINNAGTVAFFAGNVTTQGVYTGDGNSITTIADSDGAFAQFTFNDVCINNHGDVAFIATPDAAPRGIFTGPDVVADAVIQVGDPLFGSTITAVASGLGAHAINDDGDIAFWYFLEDGRQGIAVAQADVAPTPGDLNGDTLVNTTDLLAMLAAWGACPPPCPPACTGDINEDCTVDVVDLLILLSNWT